MRSALQPISASQANRMSLGPKTAAARKSSIGARRPSMDVRASIAAARRSTLAGGPQKSVDDPRPLKDPQWRTGAIRRVIEFLVSNGYNATVSVKQLQAPSTKDFLQILQFLYTSLDPDFGFSSKWEDEVIAVFRKLRYPFTINKSYLSALGAPHAWPHLLGALSWLVELLDVTHPPPALTAQYDQRVVSAMARDVAEGLSPEKSFFEYLARSYERYLDVDEDALQRLDAQFLTLFRP